MKLPDFTADPELNRLKQRMGIPKDQFGAFSFLIDPFRASAETIAQLESESGYEASLDDVQVLEDGTLSIKNRRIVLYIRDKRLYKGSEELPRFHVTNCSVLRKMWQDNRFGKYVSYSKDDGIFLVNFFRNNAKQTRRLPLPVCRSCLDQLSYRGYTSSSAPQARMKAVNAFSLKEFFSDHPRSFHSDSPRFCFETAPLDVYPANFAEISRQVRQNRGWKCEKVSCRSDFSTRERAHYRRYLHVHHRNGEKYDNAPGNLTCLCLKCHAEEPQHGHMRATKEYREFLDIWKSL